MQPIHITKNRPELKGQLDFLIKQEFRIVYSKYKRLPYVLVGWTVLIVLLTLLPETSNVIALKGVMIFLTSLVWIVAFIFMVTIIIKKVKRVYWRNKAIADCSENDIEALMTFDTEKICFTTSSYRSELNWEYYSYYAFDKDSIFIFPERNLYEAIYYSQAEIGSENFEALKSIVKQKLTLVAEGART